jgi:hypothetical protein
MQSKYFGAGILALFVMIGWNVFLIQRDSKLFDAYKQRNAEVCAQIKSFHSDCQR